MKKQFAVLLACLSIQANALRLENKTPHNVVIEVSVPSFVTSKQFNLGPHSQMNVSVESIYKDKSSNAPVWARAVVRGTPTHETYCHPTPRVYEVAGKNWKIVYSGNINRETNCEISK